MGADDKSGSTGTNYKSTAVGPDEYRTMSTETEPEDTEGQSKSMAVGPDEYRTMSTETEPEDTGSTEATSKQL
jgi:hypothetical protein